MKKLIFIICFLILAGSALAFNQNIIFSGSNDFGTNYVNDPNVVGAWYLTGSTTETDQSGNGEDLSVSASDTIPTSTTVPSGYSGTSRDIESTETEWLYAADGGSTDISGANQSITYMGWFRPENDTAANMYLVSKYDAAAGSRQYSLIYGETNDLFYCNLSSDGASYTSAYGTTGITYGSWIHLACVYNDTDIRLYVNGALDTVASENPKAYTAGIFNGDQPFRIGAENADKYYDGLVDEVIVFDRALSATEVLEIYNKGISGNKGKND